MGFQTSIFSPSLIDIVKFFFMFITPFKKQNERQYFNFCFRATKNETFLLLLGTTEEAKSPRIYVQCADLYISESDKILD